MARPISKWNNRLIKEVFFQVLLHIVVFLFFSFDKDNPVIPEYQYWFFLNYATGALIINYALLPSFFYRKRYLLFFAALALVLSAMIVVEEFVLEKIYFPDTRGLHFQGLTYSVLDVMPIIIILSGFKFAWDASVKQREVDALKASVKDSELRFLKSQVNPHFLFNNLNNLYSFAIEKSPRTPSIILDLSSVLRYMLYDCREDYVPLSKEMAHLGNYIRLSKLQVEDRGTVDFTVGNLGSNYEIAPLILTVFVENAFKHSTASQSEGIVIRVSCKVTEGLFEFSCENSCQNKANTENTGSGIGLDNVKKRLGLIYPGAHTLSIKASDSLYSVRLGIRLTKRRGQ